MHDPVFPTSGFIGDEAIRQRLHRECLAAIGRYSGSGSGSGVSHAVADLFDVLADLRDRFGVDLFGAIDRSEVRDRLAASPLIYTKDAAGNRFANRYLVVDIRATHNAVLAVSAGSGKKVSADGIQPAIAFHADVVARHRPALVLGVT